MTITSELIDASLSSALVQETKSTPTLKQTFYYFKRPQGSLVVVAEDDQSHKRLSSACNSFRDFLYVSCIAAERT